jgi:hypothetical protein
VVAPSSLFQITVGGEHAVKHHGLAGSEPVRLYFGVPPGCWASFGRQSYVRQKGVLAWVWAAWCDCSERLRTLCRRSTVAKTVDGWIGTRGQ